MRYGRADARSFHARHATTILSVALVAVLAGCSEAESRDAPAADGPAAAATETPVRRTVPVGTSMTFRIDETISTETHGPGDRFTATLRSGVADVEGTEVISEGTPSEWIVTESSTADGQALLAIALESVRVDGDWVPVGATVTEATIDADDPDTDGETAAKIGVGTAAGALIGQILGGDTESTLAGAGVGAALGAAVAISTRGGSATLPAGSTVVVQLDEPLVIS